MRVSTWQTVGDGAPDGADRDGRQGDGRPEPGRPTGPVDGAADQSWLWFLAACALACGLYLSLALSLPPRTAAFVKAGIYTLVGLSGAAAILAGIRRHRPPVPLGWWLILAGMTLFTVGDLVYDFWSLRGVEPFPSPADGLYLLGYPLIAAGLLVMVRARAQGRERAGLVDALILATGMGLLCWEFLVSPYVADPSLSPATVLVSIAYPLMDLLLLATAVRLVVGRVRSTVALTLLVVGLSAQLVSDIGYAALTLRGTYTAGGVLDLGWLIAYACLGAAALHPSMRALTGSRRGVPVRLGRARIGLLVAMGLVPPLLLFTNDRVGSSVWEVPLITAGVALLAALVFMRIAGLAELVAAQADTNQRLLDRTVRAAEKERAQIAADLHDGPIQRLAGVGLTAELARRRLARGRTAEALALLEQLGEDVSGEISALRRVMTELHPPILAESGLGEALRTYAQEFERRTGIRCVGHADPVRRLDPSRETVLYRITQEALTNVARHANATTVWVTLRVGADRVRLTVLDDGNGFAGAVTRLVDQGHYGLAGMRQRAEMAGGTFEVLSRPGGGTTILVTLPYPAPP